MKRLPCHPAKTTGCAALLAFCLAALAACQALPAPQAAPTGIQTLLTVDYVGARSYAELVQQAEVIVIGQVVDAAESYHTPEPATGSGEQYQPMVTTHQVYVFSVKQVLKGEVQGELFLVNREGTYLSDDTGAPVGESVVIGEEVYPLVEGQRYLVFLTRCCESAAGRDIPERVYYGGAVEPWLFVLPEDDGGLVTVQSPWYLAGTYFPSVSLDDLLAYIADPSLAPEITPASPQITPGYP